MIKKVPEVFDYPESRISLGEGYIIQAFNRGLYLVWIPKKTKSHIDAITVCEIIDGRYVVKGFINIDNLTNNRLSDLAKEMVEEEAYELEFKEVEKKYLELKKKLKK